jgi:hypothetical protein
MKIGVTPIAFGIVLLTGCGLSDQYATFMPKILRQPSSEPAEPDPEPDVKALIRANADTLFTAHPSALAVSRPHRITGRGFSVCVKAVVVGSPAPTDHVSRDHRTREACRSSPSDVARRLRGRDLRKS